MMKSAVFLAMALCLGCLAGTTSAESLFPEILDGIDTRPEDPKPKCGPVCMIYCKSGHVMDDKGCPTCKCKPEPKTKVEKCPPCDVVKCAGPPKGQACETIVYMPEGECACKICPTFECKPKVEDVPVIKADCAATNDGCNKCKRASPEHAWTCTRRFCISAAGPKKCTKRFRNKCGSVSVCKMLCPSGNVMDDKGCPTCKCQQPCPIPMCWFPGNQTNQTCVTTPAKEDRRGCLGCPELKCSPKTDPVDNEEGVWYCRKAGKNKGSFKKGPCKKNCKKATFINTRCCTASAGKTCSKKELSSNCKAAEPTC